MSETTGDDANDELRLMTRIDGEAARLLVHIEPIEEGEDRPSETSQPAQPPPPDTPGLAE
jgi:hypothetical protein